MSRTAQALGVIGVGLAALSAGLAEGGDILGPERVLGEAWVEDGGLRMAPGSQVVLGQGEVVSLRLDMGEADLDVVHGPLDDPSSFAHFDGEGMGLFDGEGRALSRGTPQRWESGPLRELTVRCRPPLLIEVDGRSLDVANGAPRPCPAGALSVAANSRLHLREASVDGRPVPFTRQAVKAEAAGVVGGALLLIGGLLGFGTFGTLLLSPLALVTPSLGIPAKATLSLLLASATAGAVMERGGWRRALAGLLTGIALLGSAGFVLEAQRPMGLDDGQSELVAKALSRSVALDTFMQKVDDAVSYYRPRLQAADEDPRPLVVALGSSSTGGNSHGRFWPEVMAEVVPEAKVLRMAWGGMTTWHVRHMLDRLDAQADVCVLYMGHNDLTKSSPGGSLRQLEAGEPRRDGFVAPVPLEDARENLSAIAQRCDTLIAMQERSTESEEALAGYKRMLEAHPDLLYADGAASLEALPYAVGMIDPVHPSPKGHQVLGEFAADALREALARPTP